MEYLVELGVLELRVEHHDVPIVAFRFRGADLWICSQHIPVLIHSPQKLAQVLPGAAGLDAADHTD